MRYLTAADTDIGTRRKTNQDSLLIRHAIQRPEDVLLCVLCDGMGGLARGEYASTAAVRMFSDWFDREQNRSPAAFDLCEVADQWGRMIPKLNADLLSYGEREQIRLGTTISAILFVDDEYLLCHVGDSRIYRIGRSIRQLTEDHTLVAQKVREGSLSARQAQRDARKNVLVQCVGASVVVTPQVVRGRVRPGYYLLCSDGFYHETRAWELRRSLRPRIRCSKKSMHRRMRQLIGRIKEKGETDNISVLLVRTRRGKTRATEKRRG